MVGTIENLVRTGIISKPEFIDKKYLSAEALSDPDYRLKQLQSMYGAVYAISCSKCHHCK